jgi:hypothetical protein
MPVLLLPDVSESKARCPTAVLAEPVVAEYIVWLPIAVLSSPDVRMVSA